MRHRVLVSCVLASTVLLTDGCIAVPVIAYYAARVNIKKQACLDRGMGWTMDADHHVLCVAATQDQRDAQAAALAKLYTTPASRNDVLVVPRVGGPDAAN